MDDARQPPPGEPNKKIELCVVCGHLAFARYPVMVGHYSGDTFAGTEARLDQVLDGRLTARRRMGLYPGPIRSSAIVLDSNARPPGAVVIGLGEPAGLVDRGASSNASTRPSGVRCDSGRSGRVRRWGSPS